jgi:hypothetical protein
MFGQGGHGSRPETIGALRAGTKEKKADAAFTISLARRSSATSRLSRMISADSSQVAPARWPVSTSAWRTHLRTVSAVPIPSFWAIAPIAAHCES